MNRAGQDIEERRQQPFTEALYKPDEEAVGVLLPAAEPLAGLVLAVVPAATGLLPAVALPVPGLLPEEPAPEEPAAGNNASCDQRRYMHCQYCYGLKMGHPRTTTICRFSRLVPCKCQL